MLQEFIRDHEAEILRRAATVARERVPSRRNEATLHAGLRTILHQLDTRLGQDAGAQPVEPDDVTHEAVVHGEILHEAGAPLPSVVFDYGAVCHAITELAAETHTAIEPREFQVINITLDEGIAAAIDAYANRRSAHVSEQQRQRIGFLAHEVRNALAAAQAAFHALKHGRAGIASTSGNVLERSLGRLQRIIDRALEEVRQRTASAQRERLPARDLLTDVESLVLAEARARNIALKIEALDGADLVEVLGDRQLLISALTNLVQNAVKFTREGGHVFLRARALPEKLRFEVEDECGGLPPGKAEDLFRPFVQKAADRSGLGLGLTITQQTVAAHEGELRVRNLPGKGCIFEIDLRRA